MLNKILFILHRFVFTASTHRKETENGTAQATDLLGLKKILNIIPDNLVQLLGFVQIKTVLFLTKQIFTIILEVLV